MKTLLLIDANSFIHRAYHALPPLTGPAGQPTGALYGLASILLKNLKENPPEYIAAAFDRPERTFRKEQYEAYKAHRPKAPDELVAQIIEARPLLNALGIPGFEAAGFEADDIIGTLAARFKKEKNIRVVILTGDLDALQLVEERVAVRVPKKGLSDIMEYGASAVEARFGVAPALLADYKGLAGDSSDNIPGVPGVGPKTAALLLKEFGALERVFKKMPQSHKLAAKVLPYEAQALLSKKLATIALDAPVAPVLPALRYAAPSPEKLAAYFKTLGFESLLRRIALPSEKKPASLPIPDTRYPIPDTSYKARDASFPILDTKYVVIPGVRFLRAHPELAASPKLKIAYDWKELIKAVGPDTVRGPVFDVKIAGWLLDPDKKNVSLLALANRFLRTTEGGEEDLLRALAALFEKELDARGLRKIYEEIELPLIRVLAEMERAGIGIDAAHLKRLRTEIDAALESTTARIYALAGAAFNLNSPKQVGEMLFEKLALASKKKTPGGGRSTSETVLRALAGEHEIARLLLEYRETFKLRSTYVEPLLALESAGRIHTTFLQTGTATGRLSSEKPNLQNIPAASAWAPKIRNAFRAAPGSLLVSLDYSQLELRLLAHISGDAELTRAFLRGDDIHTLTASKIFRLPPERITKDLRRIGKTLNFGMVYGMGPRALSETGGIPLSEAKAFIGSYFASFPGIRTWQEHTRAFAKTHGFVANLNGRRRVFPQGTSHPRIVAEIERMAVNMPTQSLSADIIKLAMIKASETIRRNKWPARLLLSIHDELLFEISRAIIPVAVPKLANLMEHVMSFSVPLKVEAHAGPRWGEVTPLEITN